MEAWERAWLLQPVQRNCSRRVLELFKEPLCVWEIVGIGLAQGICLCPLRVSRRHIGGVSYLERKERIGGSVYRVLD